MAEKSSLRRESRARLAQTSPMLLQPRKRWRSSIYKTLLSFLRLHKLGYVSPHDPQDEAASLVPPCPSVMRRSVRSSRHRLVTVHAIVPASSGSGIHIPLRTRRNRWWLGLQQGTSGRPSATALFEHIRTTSQLVPAGRPEIST